MYAAYTECVNLTGAAIIGPSIKNNGMSMAYINCQNLTSAKIYTENLYGYVSSTLGYALLYATFTNCNNINSISFYHENTVSALEAGSGVILKCATGNPSVTVHLECPCDCTTDVLNNFDKQFSNLSMITVNANYSHTYVTSNYITPNGVSVNLI